MKHALIALWISGASLVPGSGSDPGSAQHSGAHSTPSYGDAIPPAGAAHALLEFENESLSSLLTRWGPGETPPSHPIPSAGLVGWWTDVYLRDTHADGSTEDLRRRAGDIDWIPVQRHAGETPAHEPLEFLAI